MQLRIWLKRFDTAFSIFFVGFWLAVWAVGSYQASRVLGLDDLIPAANSWLDLWR